jgi:hypothetical protein
LWRPAHSLPILVASHLLIAAPAHVPSVDIRKLPGGRACDDQLMAGSTVQHDLDVYR